MEAACALHGIPAVGGSGDTEIAKDKKTGEVRIRVNPKFYQPAHAEVEQLLGTHQGEDQAWLDAQGGLTALVRS